MRSAFSHLQSDITRHTFRSLNRFVLPAVKAGLVSPLPLGVGLVVLETTGRISGEPRQVPLVAVRFGRQTMVSTLRDDSQWVKNLEAHPEAAVWVGGRKRKVVSSVDSGLLSVASLVDIA